MTMKVKARIVFDMELIKAEKVLLPIRKPVSKDGDNVHVVELFTDTKEYSYLIDELNKLGADISETRENIYTKEELAASELLQIIPNSYCGFPQPQLDGSYVDISFDSSRGCKECSYGRIQNKPLRLHKPKIGKNDIVGVWWLRELIITSRLKNIIEQENMTGCEIWSVIDHKKKVEFEDLFQVYVTSELPPMSQEANIIMNYEMTLDNETIESKCGTCGRGESLLKGDVIYKHSSLETIKDFNLSKEWFGSCMEIWRWIFVSQRVYRLFQEHNIKGVRFIPVTIVE
jgi:hypothetical protein